MNPVLRVLGILALIAALVPGRVLADQTDVILAFTADTQSNAGTALTLNGITVAGNNRELLVSIELANNVTINTVNYNPGTGNVAMTLVNSQLSPNSTVKVAIYALKAPAVTAAGSVAITVSAASDIILGASVYKNVDQTTPIVSNPTASGNTNAPTITTAATSRQAIFAALAQDTGTTTETPSANFREQFLDTTTGGSGGGTENGSVGDQPGTSPTVSWTLSATRQWAIATVVLQAVGGNPTAAHYRHAAAVAGPDRVRLTWSTGLEVDNVGFRIWREDASGRHRVSQDVIAGSALFVSGRTLPHGRTYVFDDMGTPDPTARYWLEDIDTHGKKTWYGPLPVTTGPMAGAAGAPLAPTGVATLAKPSKKKSRGRAALAAKRTKGDSALALQQQVAAHPAVRIRVNGAGWYRVTGAELFAAGVPSGVEAKQLSLTCEGSPVSLLVRANGRALAASDAIEFFGTGQDTTWTDSHQYWLSWHEGPGSRLTSVRAPAPARTPATGFPYRVERHDRSFYAADVHNGEADNFFGPILFGTAPVDQPVELPHPDFSGAGVAVLTVALQGFSDNHAVTVSLNGTAIGTVTWSGSAPGQATFAVPVGAIVDGTNTVTLAGGTDDDVSAVNYIQVDYPHAYTADSDALYLTATGGTTAVIRGFSKNNVRVVDVTDPGNATEVLGTIGADGAGYRVALAVPGSGVRTLIAFTDDAPAVAAGLAANHPSTWHAAGNAGRLVILAHHDFAAAMEPLRARRAGQLGSAVIVDVQDVYDEFNFGDKSPFAMRDFLTAAAGWRQAPRYVLLAGDATFNPRLYAQDGFDGSMDFDFVPTKIVDTTSLETASDDWFTDADGDGIADVPVGRLPVRTADEAAAAVAKILAYEDGAADPSWTRSAVLVSDATDGLTDFDESAQIAARGLPAGWTTRTISVGTEGSGAARNDLLQSLSGGSGAVVFFGHAAQDQWCEPGILFTDDSASLTAGYRMPVMLSMCCLTGLFHDIFVECIAKRFVKTTGAPVALWASSGFCSPAAQPALALGFLSHATASGALGDAAIAAKKSVQDHDARVSWILFGDPAMKMR